MSNQRKKMVLLIQEKLESKKEILNIRFNLYFTNCPQNSLIHGYRGTLFRG